MDHVPLSGCVTFEQNRPYMLYLKTTREDKISPNNHMYSENVYNVQLLCYLYKLFLLREFIVDKDKQYKRNDYEKKILINVF